RLYYLSLVLSVLHYRFCLSSLSLLFCLFRFVFSLCSSCSCLFRCLSDSIPPRSIFASLELLLPSCCCSFPFPRVHLSKSLANSLRFLLTSCLACSKLIACCSLLCLIFLESYYIFFILCLFL